MIDITETAKTYLTNTAVKNDKPYVRFSVKGGGCAGFKYEWNFASSLSIGLVFSETSMCSQLK